MKKLTAPHFALVLCVLLFVFNAPAVRGASPDVKIADGPLFNARANVHPNMLLSLSVEFPTVGAAYRGADYDRTSEYLGYFNQKKCYGYKGSNRNPVEADAASYFFHIEKDADALHECGGGFFSGNFMNWAASSAIDMLRYALTGGDRIVDTATETILQRAVLRDGTSTNFYAHGTYFPRRTVKGGGNVSAPKMVTPFDVPTLYVVSCRNRILFSDKSSVTVDSKAASSYCTSKWDGLGTPPLQATDKLLGDYLARVRVCDANEGAERQLCRKYGGAYKPVGAIQRKADKLRIGAMGYLLDDDAQRYGGVLRAPIKYVGSRKRDPVSLLEVDNDKLEWNPDTGVFYNNPENPADRDGADNSGVINYLNKFGRSGDYKRYDPVSELYYEGIRYFQGKGPTPDAVKDMTDAMKGGFPVIEKWEDPVVASCQNNYIVSIADVNTHWDRYIPGNNRTTYGTGLAAFDFTRPAEAEVAGKAPALNVLEWTKKVGAMETDTAGTYTNPAKNPNLAGLEARDTGASGHGTYYMAGLSYWANTHDIRLDKPTRVKTFAIDVDEGGNGQIDGNPRTIKPRDSQLYLAAKYGGFESRTAANNPFITIAPDKTEIGSSYTEWSDGSGPTAVPKNYFLASQPKEMIEAIGKVFDAATSEGGTISGVSVSTTSIATSGAYVYQPGYESSAWSGSLKKLKLTLDGNKSISIGQQAEWDAADVLTGSAGTSAKPQPDARKIYTSKPAGGGALSTVEFKWELLGDTQKASLDLSPIDQVADGRGKDRVEFLRGKRDLESDKDKGVFRARKKILGDVINGNPAYVGAPASNVQGEDYLAFYEARKGRATAVYIGANDGMLHAFNAGDGTELFAYVPNALIPMLNQLTSPQYQHRPYVDGMLTVAEARASGTWKTVLASGMGGGAQGVFALDVTDPANFESGSKALFEFTDADDPDMGSVIGTPVIAKFQTGTTNGMPSFTYFVVVASGLNNYKDDGEKRFNTDAAGALFLLSLDKEPSVAWKEGDNYFKIRVPGADPVLQNGLSAPALVLGAGGAVRYVYAGDLQGSLWRFDFSDASVWSKLSSAATRVFVAKDGQGVRQPITTQPRAVFAPGGGYVVLFGTGKFVEEADAAPGNFSVQSFYGILDSTASGYAVSGRAELTERLPAKSGTGFKISGGAVPYGTSGAGSKGWYLDFLDSAKTGERSVTNPLTTGGHLFFNSLIPATSPCDSGGGRTYVLDTLNGLPSNGVTGVLSTIGMLSSPVAFETGVEVGDRNAIGRRTVKKKYSVVNFGTSVKAPEPSESIETRPRAGRFSWREILNWQELRNAYFKK